MELAVEARNLKKNYGERKVIDSLTLEIRKGECFGLLGPNGAGKSTFLSLLSGLARPGDGELFVLGLSVRQSLREIKSRIGVVPQGDGLDPDLTVRENLVTFASYFGIRPTEIEVRVQELLRMMRMEERADERIESLSGGLKRRVALIRGLLNDPELLLMDEPTLALDPLGREWIWDFLKSQKAAHRTQILSTHDMNEAELLCDRLALIHRGRLLEIGTPRELVLKHWGTEVVEFVVPQSDVSYYANRLKEKNFSFQALGSRFLLSFEEGQRPPELFQLLSRSSYSVRKPDLNDVFLKLTGAELAVEEAE